MGPGQEPSFTLPPSPRLSPLFSSFFLALCLSSLVASVHALESTGWSVLPSNSSEDLAWTNNVRFQVENAQINLPSGISLAPLTRGLVHQDQTQLSDFHASGQLVAVEGGNTLTLDTGDIAFVSCDPSDYPGALDASKTVAHLLTNRQQPSAVLLYSTEAHHCNYSANDASSRYYQNVFTLLSANNSRPIQAALDSSSGTGTGTTTIVADMSFPLQPVSPNTGGGDGDGNSPNTAMIILYSITGIITALFLAIIITGAVRAHRHPERYGPRYRPGRPRQSRARGIARAMLETIPIVKFGDDYDPKADPVKGDVEMPMESDDLGEGRDREMTAAGTPTAGAGATTNDSQTQTQTPTTTTTTPPTATDSTENRTGAATSNSENPNFSCPICTDDFVKGQDLRVLPCNHKFHPECIDPWLVNVSGTCPLCRIDLNPPQAEGEQENAEGDGHPDAAHEGTQDAQTEQGSSSNPASTHTSRHRRLSNYLHGPLNARRMRDASVEERIAALRSVREETNMTETVPEADEQQQGRSRRLTQRLRDRFRIRTRPHGEEPEGQS